MKLGVFRPEKSLRPIIQEAIEGDPDFKTIKKQAKLCLFKANFPEKKDLDAYKQSLKADGRYTWLQWRKILNSNNTYSLKILFTPY